MNPYCIEQQLHEAGGGPLNACIGLFNCLLLLATDPVAVVNISGMERRNAHGV
jgi:hypothetical protein